jgi:hypothetical protein
MGIFGASLILNALLGQRIWWRRCRLAAVVAGFAADACLAYSLRVASGFDLLGALVLECIFPLRHTGPLMRLQRWLHLDISAGFHKLIGIGTLPLAAGHAAGLGNWLSTLLVALYSIVLISSVLPGFLSLFALEPGQLEKAIVRAMPKEKLKAVTGELVKIQKRVQHHPKVWLLFHGLAFCFLILVVLHAFAETYWK